MDPRGASGLPAEDHLDAGRGLGFGLLGSSPASAGGARSSEPRRPNGHEDPNMAVYICICIYVMYIKSIYEIQNTWNILDKTLSWAFQ